MTGFIIIKIHLKKLDIIWLYGVDFYQFLTVLYIHTVVEQINLTLYKSSNPYLSATFFEKALIYQGFFISAVKLPHGLLHSEKRCSDTS